ncbi:hypothetical protein SBA3_1210003 [Candidatus Sulfopaludibacter sp. SbA3]|nr:hypothetical protein SBA3_1210003 [Candidatus Sulfopaludibacter sp. SbA3]
MYRMHRVFCASAWELEGERRAFYDAITQVNEANAMRAGVLFVPVSLMNVRDKRPIQHALEENIQACSHYMLAVSGGWGPLERNFKRDYRLANECCADPALPMRSVSLLVRREPGEPSPFAQELSTAGIAFAEFVTLEEFQGHVRQLLVASLAAEVCHAAGAAAV